MTRRRLTNFLTLFLGTLYIVAGIVITNSYYHHKWLNEKNSLDNSAAQQAVERSETAP